MTSSYTLSASAWMRTASTSSGVMTLLHFVPSPIAGQTAPAFTFGVIPASGCLFVRAGVSTATHMACTGTLNDDAWHFVSVHWLNAAVLGTASTVRLFADGSELGSQTNTSFTVTAAVASGCLSIGGKATRTCSAAGWTGGLSPTELFQGSLAQVSRVPCRAFATLASVAVIAANDVD